jgi:peroxiredoxin
MPALTPGKAAPAISLKDVNGQDLTLADALKKGPVLAAFFKVSCPVCQFAFPFIERLHEEFGGSNFTVWGVSQDDPRDTRIFMDEYKIKFPVLVDGRGYPASNQYGLTNVPSLFLISQDGKIQVSHVGFDKAGLEHIAAEAADASRKAPTSLFRPGEVVPEYKPG